ncbi:hypothetical protein FDP41_005722 [Naegleria fowleri]|uniref:Uncharacterized protein n=1 Tax=Naegleria fowleri TaxID=5763 RepID=A0A6A5BPV6_NAEFO|nr:uncharacterized protein FDP41_005722 [Naegleria fowleri]KAF0974969.1 hypothetical protein FDP41_005722 [Naegleria fowleri]
MRSLLLSLVILFLLSACLVNAQKQIYGENIPLDPPYDLQYFISYYFLPPFTTYYWSQPYAYQFQQYYTQQQPYYYQFQYNPRPYYYNTGPYSYGNYPQFEKEE